MTHLSVFNGLSEFQTPNSGFAAVSVSKFYSLLKTNDSASNCAFLNTERRGNPAVYIMAIKPNGTIYVGATSDLVKRAYLNRNNLLDGFSKKYACKSLSFFKIHETMESAIL